MGDIFVRLQHLCTIPRACVPAACAALAAETGHRIAVAGDRIEVVLWPEIRAPVTVIVPLAPIGIVEPPL